MVALRPADVEPFLAKPDPRRSLVLIYGPDAGLVRERVQRLLNHGDNSENPFAVVTVDGDTLAADPARLADEARTIGLFGGRRLVHVRAGGRSFSEALNGLIADPPRDSLIVIEAGDLRKGAPLRKLLEAAPAAAVIPCYADDTRALLRLVDDAVSEAGLSIDGDARDALVSLLGGDRMATRSELDKLVVYTEGKQRIAFEDVQAVTADAAALALDDVTDAAAAGEPEPALAALARARGAGIPAATVLGAAIRHVALLHRLSLKVERGERAAQLIERKEFNIHFRRKPRFERALSRFSPAALEGFLAALSTASLAARRSPILAEAIAEREILALARGARRRQN